MPQQSGIKERRMSYRLSDWMTFGGEARPLFGQHPHPQWGFNFASLSSSATFESCPSSSGIGNSSGGGVSMGQGVKGGAGDDEDEVEFVRGPENELPHLRSDCISHLFSKSPKPSNFASCTRCFCYLCNTTVSTCADWISHCHASYDKKAWKKIQKRFEDGRAAGKSNAEIAAEMRREKLALGGGEGAGEAANVMWTGDGGSWGSLHRSVLLLAH